MSEKVKLKPCPFCGGEAVLKDDLWGESFCVRCKRCRARTDSFITGLDGVPDDEIAAQDMAREAWNRRVAP